MATFAPALFVLVLIASLTTGDAVTFSPDNEWFAWGADAGKVHLYTMQFEGGYGPGKDNAFDGGNGSRVTEVAFSADSKTIAVAAADQVRLHDLTSGVPPVLKHVIVPPQKYNDSVLTVTSMAISPGSLGWLAVAASGSNFGARDNAVHIYDLEGTQGPVLKHTLTNPAKCKGCVQLKIVSVAFSKDAKWLAVDYEDFDLRMYALDTESGAPEFRFTLPGGANSVTFSPESRRLAVAYSPNDDETWGATSIFAYLDPSTPSPGGWAAKQSGIGPPSALAAEYSPDGKWLATGGGHQYIMGQAGPGVLSVNAVDSEGRAANSFSFKLGEGDYIDGAAFSSDSRWLAVTSMDKKARLFSVASGSWDLKYTLQDMAKPDEQRGEHMVV